MKKKEGSLFKQFISEYKQVHWPNRIRVSEVTTIVLIITIFVAVMVTLFDFGFSTLMDQVSRTLKSLIN